MKWKKYILAAVLVLAAAAGIGFAAYKPGYGILEGASPDTSALHVYYYDGETVKMRTLYDSNREKELIKRINGIPLKEANEQALEDLNAPFYGIWIGGMDGYGIAIAWADDVWLKNDGTVCYGDKDFRFLWEELEGEDEDDGLSVLGFPNAGQLSRYNLAFLEKTEEIPDSAGGVSMSVERIFANGIEINIQNSSEEEFIYGEYYSLQKKIDGSWYTMPFAADHIAFPAIAWILPAGESVTKSYDLSIFGPLEPGAYKLVVEHMGVEFAVID